MNTITPAAAAAHVLEFCKYINPNVRPTPLAITPDIGCEPLDCFGSVRARAKLESEHYLLLLLAV